MNTNQPPPAGASTGTPVFRRADAGDLAQIFDIRVSVTENHLDREQLRERGITEETMAQAMATDLGTWVAEADGRILGFSMAQADDGRIFVLVRASRLRRRRYRHGAAPSRRPMAARGRCGHGLAHDGRTDQGRRFLSAPWLVDRPRCQARRDQVRTRAESPRRVDTDTARTGLGRPKGGPGQGYSVDDGTDGGGRQWTQSLTTPSQRPEGFQQNPVVPAVRQRPEPISRPCHPGQTPPAACNLGTVTKTPKLGSLSPISPSAGRREETVRKIGRTPHQPPKLTTVTAPRRLLMAGGREALDARSRLGRWNGFERQRGPEAFPIGVGDLARGDHVHGGGQVDAGARQAEDDVPVAVGNGPVACVRLAAAKQFDLSASERFALVEQNDGQLCTGALRIRIAQRDQFEVLAAAKIVAVATVAAADPDQGSGTRAEGFTARPIGISALRPQFRYVRKPFLGEVVFEGCGIECDQRV